MPVVLASVRVKEPNTGVFFMAFFIFPESSRTQESKALAETRIAVRQARETLSPLGTSKETLTALRKQSEHVHNRYRMTIPFEGKIIEQHITLGEVLTRGSTAFVVADTRQA